MEDKIFDEFSSEEKKVINEMGDLLNQMGKGFDKFNTLVDKRVSEARSKMTQSELKEFNEICKDADLDEKIIQLNKEMNGLRDKIKGL